MTSGVRDVPTDAVDTPAAVPGADARRRWWLVPLGIFLLSRVADAVLLLFLARSEGSAEAYPGNGAVPVLREPASYFNVVQNWDGQWFRLIAEHGYPSTLPTDHGVVTQNQWAFYPLFPGLVRAIMSVTHLPFGVAASFLNIALASIAMCLVYRMVSRTASGFAGAMTVVVLSTFPSAVVFQLAYSEALTFLLVVTALWCLSTRRYGGVLAAGVLLSLTRPIVLPLVLVVGLHAFVRWRTRDRDPFPTRERVRLVAAAVGLALSFGIWPLIGWLRTGTPNAYTDSIGSWSRTLKQQQGYVSWVTDAFTGHWVAGTAMILAVAAQWFLLLRSKHRFLWPPELRWWSLSYGAYILLATRPQTSFVRHAMLAIVPWWPFPEVGEQVRSRREMVLLASMAGAFGLAAQFFWIRWLFIPGPHFLPTGFP